jgi:membrane protease YdiL (CAAX protease family)
MQPDKKFVASLFGVWLFFVPGMGMLQLWLSPLGWWQRGETKDWWAFIAGGQLVFFAAALSMQVSRDSWTRLKRHQFRGRIMPSTVGVFLRAFVIPFVVVIVGTITFGNIQGGVQDRILTTQALVLAVAMVNNLVYFYDTAIGTPTD